MDADADAQRFGASAGDALRMGLCDAAVGGGRDTDSTECRFDRKSW